VPTGDFCPTLRCATSRTLMSIVRVCSWLMKEVHLVYPCDNPATTPGAIGWHVREALERVGYSVTTHDWEGSYKIRPTPGAILLGHPHPSPMTVYRRSVKDAAWGRRIAMLPLNGDIFQFAFAYKSIARSDETLGIMGPEWAGYLDLDPQMRAVRHKITPVDLAIDASLFPLLPNRAPHPRQRRVIYIGHTGNYKSPEYLEAIRKRLPDVEFGWLGRGSRQLAGFTPLGYVQSDSQAGRDVLADYHFLLSVGHADANPTTVLESLAVGIIPLTTRGSGWGEHQGVVRIPSGDPHQAAMAIRRMVNLDGVELQTRMAANRELVEQQFSWSRFTDVVLNSVGHLPRQSVDFTYSDSRIGPLSSFAQIQAAVQGPRIAPAHAYHRTLRRLRALTSRRQRG
jgi:hypothetical protein